MTRLELPSAELLNRMFSYNEETGKVYWRARTPESFIEERTRTAAFCNGWNKRFCGKEAGSIAPNGYYYITICNKKYLLHRIVWKIVTGNDPLEMELDHINTITTDNRIFNLRIATSSDNSKNVKKHSDNVSGFKGVTFNKRTNAYIARIRVNRRQVVLGTFPLAEQAHAAYAKAAENHYGQFARTA